jgi:hypothetical protein
MATAPVQRECAETNSELRVAFVALGAGFMCRVRFLRLAILRGQAATAAYKDNNKWAEANTE